MKKNLKSHQNISLKDDCSDFLVEKIKLKNNSIVISSNLLVPDGYSFVIGKNGKVFDFFTSGEHELSYSNLPICCKKLKIERQIETTAKQSFVADAYFVNTNYMAMKWESYKNTAGSRAEGYIRYSFGGVYTFKVKDVCKFMQSLLNELSFIKNGEAEKILDAWIQDAIISIFDKNIFTVDQIINNDKVIQEKLFETIKKMCTDVGLDLVDFNIEYYKLPKKYQKQNDEIMKKQKNLNVESQNKYEKSQGGDSILFKPFGSFIIKQFKPEQSSEQSLELKVENSSANNNQNLVEEENQNNLIKEKSFVDLNVDNLYNTKVDN